MGFSLSLTPFPLIQVHWKSNPRKYKRDGTLGNLQWSRLKRQEEANGWSANRGGPWEEGEMAQQFIPLAFTEVRRDGTEQGKAKAKAKARQGKAFACCSVG
ncbi:hypothetical protein CDL15_Pgr029078 [Punica granatum]|uniref:Uncharacterized protein n=1 Tax=Punica granatum TaxID=22663 RepID=A0A218XKA5_PUNGR|nr:hypothetical protein CDL15_Pgr029078 [Punica granatum]